MAGQKSVFGDAKIFAMLLLVLASAGFSYNITANSTEPCPAWTAFWPEHIEDIKINDMGYVRRCSNVTYVSYCISTPKFVNYSHARHYTDINCSDADYCQGWTKFYIEKTINKTERSPENLTRVCTNTTYVSWCIKSTSNIDYRTARRYYDIKCGEWGQACYYEQVSASNNSIQRNGAYCRLCNITKYRNVCDFGKPSYGPIQTQAICSEWYPCEGVSSYLNATSQTSNAQAAAIDSTTLTVALFGGLVFSIILVLLFGLHKKE